MLLSYTIVDFHLFYDGAVDIQIWAPLTKNQCKVSGTQVTVKACGPLVYWSTHCLKMYNERRPVADIIIAHSPCPLLITSAYKYNESEIMTNMHFKVLPNQNQHSLFQYVLVDNLTISVHCDYYKTGSWWISSFSCIGSIYSFHHYRSPWWIASWGFRIPL